MANLNNIITALSITSPNGDVLTFDNTNFVLNEIKGLEAPAVRLPKWDLPGQQGAFVSNSLYGGRTITIKGTILSSDNTVNTYLNNRSTLINTLAFFGSNSTISPQTLTITLANGQVLTANVYVDKPIQMGFSEDQLGWEEFMISLFAPDPNLYSTSVISTTISLPTGGGTAIPTAVPASLAAQSGGSATINNLGSVTAFPTITLTGPLTNPNIVNNRTSQFIQLIYTINIGDQPVIINCAKQTITQGANNVIGIQTASSTFWGLLTGNNSIGFSASGGAGTCVIAFFPIDIGI